MGLISFLNEIDQSLLLFLNGFHNKFWDLVMLLFTRKEIWVPLYVVFCLLLLKKYRLKFILILGILILALVVSDQFSVLIKETVKRLRPTHDPEIGHLVHNFFRKGGLHGFFSSHASNTIAIAYLTARLFKNRWYTLTIFTWALIVSYSRIYLGVHYPFDILVGILWGLITGYMLYHLMLFVEKKISWPNLPSISETRFSTAESMYFIISFIIMIICILLVVGRLQHYNYL